jgi:cytochrome P450/NADPH-cytochrome P450 reductase
MTTSQPLEDRQTTPLTVDDIPGPKGLPVVGNMFDVPPESTIVSLMKLVREYGPMIRLRTPGGDRFAASGLAMIDDLCDDERFDKLVGGGPKLRPERRIVHFRHR